MKKLIPIAVAALLAACAGKPKAEEEPPPSALPTDATEKLLTDTKFQEGLDAAMAGGSTLEPFVQKLAEVPPTDESRVLMTALLEEEAKRRPLTAAPLIIPPPPSEKFLTEPAPPQTSRSSPKPESFWSRNRVIGAVLAATVLGFVLMQSNYKLVITAP